MTGIYAIYVAGAKDVIALDADKKPMKYRVIRVEQGSHNELDAKTMQQVVKLGKMTVKLDGRTYECLEFKKFGSQREYEEWASFRPAPPAPPQAT